MIDADDFIARCERKRSELKKLRRIKTPTPMSYVPSQSLPSGWRWTSLSEVCERVSVGHVGPTTEHFEDAPTSALLIRSQNVRPGFLDLNDCATITLQFHEKCKKSQLQRSDILIVRVGANRGDVAILPATSRPTNCANVIFARPIFDGSFFAYYLQSDAGRKSLISLTTGSAQGVLNTEDVARLPVPVPPQHIQDRVVSILKAYDDLIEVNRRRISLLEEMVRRLFEEWFVRFHFPGYEGQVMVETPDGPLPEGWSVGPLSAIAGFVRGRSYRSVDLVEIGGIPFINLKCFLRDGGFKESGIKRYAGPYKPDQLLRRGDIVIAVTDMTQERRIVGQAARIPQLDELPAVHSMDVLKIVPSLDASNTYLYHWLRFSDFSAKAAQRANGVNVLHLSPSAIGDFPILIPDQTTQALFAQHVTPINDECDVLKATEKRLTRSRDLLLPRLVGGELLVSAAMQELEAVA